jgi:hypothetical protein
MRKPAVLAMVLCLAAPGLAGGEAERFEPEHERGLREVLLVYDQVAADYLFR